MNDETAAKVFASLGNAHRVGVLRLLVRAGADGLNVTALRQRTGLPPSTMAHHLRMLADAGLIEQERQGRDLISRAAYKAIRQLNDFLMKDCCKDAFSKRRAA
ncbi:MAG: metalloregulator ArsR/SmtB family transcription factor [Pseudomonadota bacterium]